MPVETHRPPETLMRKVQILHVEDDTVIASFVSRALQRRARDLGIALKLVTKNSLSTALKELKSSPETSNRFDLIVTDWNLGYRRYESEEEHGRPLYATPIIHRALRMGIPVRILSGTNDSQGSLEKLRQSIEETCGITIPLKFLNKRNKGEAAEGVNAPTREFVEEAIKQSEINFLKDMDAYENMMLAGS